MLILKVNMFADCYFNTHRVQVPATDNRFLISFVRLQAAAQNVNPQQTQHNSTTNKT